MLKDISFSLRRGEHIAMVGMNGSGKTTCIKLLCRLLEPDSGTIYLDGTDIKTYTRESCWKLFSADYIVLFAGVVIMFAVSLLERKCPVRDRLAKKNYIIRYTVFLVIFLLIAVFGIYGIGYESSQFIYNQF